ncbi:MAG: CRISPR-associated exonuclease Cas4 [Clostridia bacterium]|nr:CRISPR-associated exonuclease Cas4 [Clostridia bacterium]
MDGKKINGTLIWYYFICKREVWLMARNLEPDQDDKNIDIGRFIQENSYERDKKEISFGNIKIDIIRKEDGQLVVGEVKKSSKFKESAKMQLLFYLSELKAAGLEAKGVLMFPKEKKREEVELTPEAQKQLQDVVKNILRIIYLDVPPKVEKIPFCKNCGYREMCYS